MLWTCSCNTLLKSFIYFLYQVISPVLRTKFMSTRETVCNFVRTIKLPITYDTITLIVLLQSGINKRKLLRNRLIIFNTNLLWKRSWFIDPSSLKFFEVPFEMSQHSNALIIIKGKHFLNERNLFFHFIINFLHSVYIKVTLHALGCWTHTIGIGVPWSRPTS
jgi:hypothetical protein